MLKITAIPLFCLLWLYGAAQTGVAQTDGKVGNPEYEQFLENGYTGGAPYMTVAQLEKVEHGKLYLLDTREPVEYATSHLKHARAAGHIWFDMRDVYDIPKEAKIVVYCTVGNRSERIAEKLIQAGYADVHFLYGGMIEWVNQGNPVYTKTEVQTPEVFIAKKLWEQWLEKGQPVL